MKRKKFSLVSILKAKSIFYLLLSAGLVLLVIFSVVMIRSFFTRADRNLKIEQTAIIVEEVKKISQLFTSVYYDELVLDTFKLQPTPMAGQLLQGLMVPRPGSLYPAFRRVELVVIARGRVMAGYDFSRLQVSDLIIEDNTVWLQLPPPEVLEVIINPSDFEIFIEEGNWSLAETVSLQQRAAGIITQRAIGRGVFRQSETSAIRLLHNFFSSLGFEKVTIQTSPSLREENNPLPSPSPEA